MFRRLVPFTVLFAVLSGPAAAGLSDLGRAVGVDLPPAVLAALLLGLWVVGVWLIRLAKLALGIGLLVLLAVIPVSTYGSPVQWLDPLRRFLEGFAP